MFHAVLYGLLVITNCNICVSLLSCFPKDYLLLIDIHNSTRVAQFLNISSAVVYKAVKVIRFGKALRLSY